MKKDAPTCYTSCQKTSEAPAPTKRNRRAKAWRDRTGFDNIVKSDWRWVYNDR